MTYQFNHKPFWGVLVQRADVDIPVSTLPNTARPRLRERLAAHWEKGPDGRLHLHWYIRSPDRFPI